MQYESLNSSFRMDVYSMIHDSMMNDPKRPIMHDPVIDRVKVVVQLALGLGFVM